MTLTCPGKALLGQSLKVSGTLESTARQRTDHDHLPRPQEHDHPSRSDRRVGNLRRFGNSRCPRRVEYPVQVRRRLDLSELTSSPDCQSFVEYRLLNYGAGAAVDQETSKGPSSAIDLRETPGSSSSRWVGGSPRRPALALFARDRAPHSSMIRAGSPESLRPGAPVLGPQPQPCVAREGGVAGHDVHLGVVEERVFVEVGRPDRQPGVVHDADLGVDVQRAGERAASGGDRGREEAPFTVVRSTSAASWPRVMSAPLFGFAGSRRRRGTLRRVAAKLSAMISTIWPTKGTGSRDR